MTISGQAGSPERKEPAGRRILLTGGRAPATLDLARQLAANGHAVYVAESCPEQLCKRSRAVRRSYLVPEPAANPRAYAAALRDIAAAERMDWLLPMCEELFYVAAGLDELQSVCRVLAEPPGKLRRLHSKWEFISRVQELGLSAPQTHLLSSPQERAAFMAEEAERAKRRREAGEPDAAKWVFKPVFSRFSSKVVIAEVKASGWQPDSRLAALPVTGEEPWVAQRYIEGTGYCSYSIAQQGTITAHAVYPVRFTAGRGACISFEPVKHPGIDRWTERFIREEGFTGQIAFDFIEDREGGLYPLECNPRATSGIHLFRPEDRLDRALMPEEGQPLPERIEPQASRKAMIAAAMLSCGAVALLKDFSRERLGSWLRIMTGGRDVVFRANDPGPLWQQFRLVYWNLRVGARHRISVMEASTKDIEWNGGELR
ncbi:ATP-dependent carboxylate-amine ligase [Paenibacillus doosanensis]|uniref:ATP-grasp domain-containing protein n=1 Tax=Paenibacillus konkukensis TaxID=2020716 RepID=A0ABY4RTX4_9BACL|nr:MULTISPECIES: ATP-dependent carboxylate-amine ligase [Paenibacillus]MCS7460954.1 ATP-dependent carboxylate-amine ligase [Paenibacillus doosanensis]UQZ85623.1 hypothetical protein SK3146_04912 [Paenibacillus konkukensis]